jgi:hypothetical protein
MQRWWLNEDRLIKVSSFFFALLLWPIFTAIELTWQALEAFDRRRE